MIANLSNALLVVAYNELATVAGLDPVKRFSDRKVGAKRVQDLVDKLVASGKVVTVADDGAVTFAAPAPVELVASDAAPVEPVASDAAPVEPVASDATPVKPVASATPVEPVTSTLTKPAAKGGVKSPSVADSDVIYVRAEGNPKKGTAALRYANYRDGVTVEGYILAIGGDRRQGLRDIAWDLRKGWIEVIGAAAARRREKAKAATIAEAAPVANAA